MSEFDPTSDGSDAPRGHRAPRPAGLGNRWAVAAAGVAVLAVALLISPALGTDGESTRLPNPSPTATPSPSVAAPAVATPKASTSPSAEPADDPSVGAAVVTERLTKALTVVRGNDDKVSDADADVTTDDTGTIAIVAKRSESYTGTDEDLVSSLLGAIELELAVPTVPAGPDVRATVSLQPISISLLGLL